MTSQKIRVGIVGLQPGRSWAALAHLPALRHLSDDYEIVGVANSSMASSQAAADACGIPRAFADVAEMAASPDVDLVAVTVKVPAHFDIVRTALDAGKHVFCEWPLGRTLEEAEGLAQLAREKEVVAVTSTQARVTPAMVHLKRLVCQTALERDPSSAFKKGSDAISMTITAHRAAELRGDRSWHGRTSGV